MKYTFLSDKFFNDHPQNAYPQIEQKTNRPYAHVHIKAYGHTFALPLRSHIEHPHAYFTNKKAKCGVDYSKAVVIDNTDYIDPTTNVRLRNDEFKRLQGKDYLIKKQFEQYVELYKQAKTDKTVDHREEILKYSTLQYFESYIENKDVETKDEA